MDLSVHHPAQRAARHACRLYAIAEAGIFHTNCGKRCEQARHLQINPLIFIKLCGKAQFLGRLDLYTARVPQTVAHHVLKTTCGIVQPSDAPFVHSSCRATHRGGAFFTNFVEKIVSNALDPGQNS